MTRSYEKSGSGRSVRGSGHVSVRSSRLNRGGSGIGVRRGESVIKASVMSSHTETVGPGSLWFLSVPIVRESFAATAEATLVNTLTVLTVPHSLAAAAETAAVQRDLFGIVLQDQVRLFPGQAAAFAFL